MKPKKSTLFGRLLKKLFSFWASKSCPKRTAWLNRIALFCRMLHVNVVVSFVGPAAVGPGERGFVTEVQVPI